MLSLDKWTYANMKFKIVEMINIEHRFQTHESITQKRGEEIFNIECDQNGGCDENCDCQIWGYI